jgi:hypothetical protein
VIGFVVCFKSDKQTVANKQTVTPIPAAPQGGAAPAAPAAVSSSTISKLESNQYRVVKVEVRDRDVATRLYPEDTPTCWITAHYDHLTILAEHVSSGVICDIRVGDTVEIYSGDPQYLVKTGHQSEEAHLKTYSPKYMYFIESQEER